MGDLLQIVEEIRFRELDELQNHIPFNCAETKAFDAFSGVAKLGVCSLYQTHASSGIITDAKLFRNSSYAAMNLNPQGYLAIYDCGFARCYAYVKCYIFICISIYKLKPSLKDIGPEISGFSRTYIRDPRRAPETLVSLHNTLSTLLDGKSSHNNGFSLPSIASRVIPATSPFQF